MDQQTKLSDGVEELARIADRPSLQALAYGLRHPDTWPEEFTWDYSSCTNCAMGLALELWGDKLTKPHGDMVVWNSWAARSFAIPFTEARAIFEKQRPPFRLTRPFASRDIEDVTPEHVADAIDKYLAKQS